MKGGKKLQQHPLTKANAATRQEIWGKGLCFLAIGLIIAMVAALLFFVTSHGIKTFSHDGVSLWQFLTGTHWNPGVVDATGQPQVGALPLIVTSFAVTILAALLATPFAFGVALYVTEISPKHGAKILQLVMELLVGIPSVVYGFLGLTLLVPTVRKVFGGSGFGILPGALLLFVMILPTITSLAIDSLNAVPQHLRQAASALGATRWQTIYKVLLPVATPGLLTAIIFGMARAFGEALAVQMVIGNATLMPTSLLTPASTLTSKLTTDIGNTIMGTLPNDVLWSLALVLLLMSLVFNLLIRLIAKKGRNYA